VKNTAAANVHDAAPCVLVNNTEAVGRGDRRRGADAFLSAFKAHLVNNQQLAQVVIPGMKDAAYGRIVNIVSTSVREPIPGLGVSNTVRAPWRAGETLAGEVAWFGITVNNVLPGTRRLAGSMR
jgi:3-oxoacyl-[acyl-carrier protein] reductase